MKLPEAYAERMKNILGEEYDDYLSALDETPVRAFRVNTDKISVEDFEKINPFSTQKIPYVNNGFYFSDEKIGNHPYHHAGMIYVQEPGAMAPIECIDIDPEWCVLDMCSAPGGKSSQIRNKLGRNGVLVSNEIIPSRCKILTGNMERLGVVNTVTTCMDSSAVARVFPQTFDLVAVDAPCSGEGMFRKEEAAVSEWSEDNVRLCADRQREILENAVKVLKDGGYIIYATCTFSLDENEKIIDWFLENHPSFELVKVKKAVEDSTCDGIRFDGCKTENINYCRRFYPHKSRGEGQFMAVLHNTSEYTDIRLRGSDVRRRADSVIADFMRDTLVEFEEKNLIMNKETPVYFTPDFSVAGATVFSCGVTIGEVRKGYILPHHQFFMAMGKYFRRKIELSVNSPEIAKYLHGEEIEVSCPNGWAVVTVDGCSVGGAKVVNGKAKNHYPKGLRLK